MTGHIAPGGIAPVVPVLSMFDQVHIGADEFGASVHMKVIYKNLLAAGEPGGGKSSLLALFAAHAALSQRSRLVLFDGKLVELGFYKKVADEFVGPDIGHAIITLRRLQAVLNNRCAWLEARQRRKVEPSDGLTTITSIFDEIALYSTVLGTDQQQKEFLTLFRDLVARGRAAAMPVIAATQRPSVDIIPKSLRDLFGYRAAFRCTSDGSSDIILGDGWSGKGFTATDIPPTNQGLCHLIAEGGTPRRVKVAYLTDDHIIGLAALASRSAPATPPSQTRLLAVTTASAVRPEQCTRRRLHPPDPAARHLAARRSGHRRDPRPGRHR